MSDTDKHVEWIRVLAADFHNDAIERRSSEVLQHPEAHIRDSWQACINKVVKNEAETNAAADHMEKLQRKLEEANKYRSKYIFVFSDVKILRRAIEDANEELQGSVRLTDNVLRIIGRLAMALEATELLTQRHV